MVEEVWLKEVSLACFSWAVVVEEVWLKDVSLACFS